MSHTRWLAGDGSHFPPSARGGRVSGSGPSRYVFGCTTSASVEVGLRSGGPSPIGAAAVSRGVPGRPEGVASGKDASTEAPRADGGKLTETPASPRVAPG